MNQLYFKREIYQRRRSILASTVTKGLVVLPSNEESGINYKDNTYPYRQDSSFLYYCGIERAGLCLLIHCESGKSILMGDELTLDDIVWTGPMPTLQSMAEASGIEKVISFKQGLEYIHSLKKDSIPLHYLPIYRGDHAFRLAQILNEEPASMEGLYSVLLASSVVAQREIKTEEEIIQITQAIDTSGMMHHAMMTFAKRGMSEAQVAAKVRSICLEKNVDLPYNMILTVNGQTLHNNSYHNTLQSGQLLLGDFGAESPMHYAGDITRTIPVDPTFTEVQKEIYQIVLSTLNTAISNLKANITYRSIHLDAARHIASGLKGLGLIKGDVDEIVNAGAHTLFFPHGLGHPLGLDVHDMEGIGEQYTGYEPGIERSKEFGLKSLRLGKTLRAGMVITVEPGIYFIPELISLWKAQNKFSEFIQFEKIEKLLPFGGIRLEDNILIEDAAATVLGNPIAKSIAEVEDLRKQAYQ